jgi:hypothetical protein
LFSAGWRGGEAPRTTAEALPALFDLPGREREKRRGGEVAGEKRKKEKRRLWILAGVDFFGLEGTRAALLAFHPPGWCKSGMRSLGARGDKNRSFPFGIHTVLVVAVAIHTVLMLPVSRTFGLLFLNLDFVSFLCDFFLVGEMFSCSFFLAIFTRVLACVLSPRWDF